jgi:hypothetical protein
MSDYANNTSTFPPLTGHSFSHSTPPVSAQEQHLVTVDRDQYIAWCNGLLMDFKNGRGIVVNELEAVTADEALSRGEPVLLRVGNRLIGRYLLHGEEHEGFPNPTKK